MITDGFRAGIEAVLWLAGAIAGAATVLGPWTAGCWLIARSARRIAQSRPAWWLKAKRSLWRQHRSAPRP